MSMPIKPEKALEDEDAGVDKVIFLSEATNYRQPLGSNGPICLKSGQFSWDLLES
jgi:hypothetical protein